MLGGIFEKKIDGGMNEGISGELFLDFSRCNPEGISGAINKINKHFLILQERWSNF